MFLVSICNWAGFSTSFHRTNQATSGFLSFSRNLPDKLCCWMYLLPLVFVLSGIAGSTFRHSSPYSRYNGTHGQLEVDEVKSDMSMGPEECLLPPSQVGYRQSFACIPLLHADPYYNGLLAAYGPQAMIHCPQMLGMANARVPLPLDLPQDEPIYVNAKQYRAILRRRQSCAKLEAQNKLSKALKVYGLKENRSSFVTFC